MKFIGTVQTISRPDREVHMFVLELEQLQRDAKHDDQLKNCETLVCQDNHFYPISYNLSFFRWSSTTLELRSVKIQLNMYFSTTRELHLSQ